MAKYVYLPCCVVAKVSYCIRVIAINIWLSVKLYVADNLAIEYYSGLLDKELACMVD